MDLGNWFGMKGKQFLSWLSGYMENNRLSPWVFEKWVRRKIIVEKHMKQIFTTQPAYACFYSLSPKNSKKKVGSNWYGVSINTD